MNNKGFAISGILYSILVLFLMLLLLILGNFQSRKVTFDKQKDVVLGRLEGKKNNNKTNEFCYSDSIQKFETPTDGNYKLEIYNSNNGTYLTGEIQLYQGILLYLTVGKDENSVSRITTEENRNTTTILSIGPNNYYYVYNSGDNDDISLDKVLNFKSPVSASQNVCNNSGLIRISRIDQ